MDLMTEFLEAIANEFPGYPVYELQIGHRTWSLGPLEVMGPPNPRLLLFHREMELIDRMNKFETNFTKKIKYQIRFGNNVITRERDEKSSTIWTTPYPPAEFP